MEAVISANKFLDLLQCTLPAVSNNNKERPYLCAVYLETLKKEYAIRAVATDGNIMSVAQRDLGFSTSAQQDIEDIEAIQKVENRNWLLSSVDVEILIMSLKKLGVKNNEDDKGLFYISLKEKEESNKLSISILGLSHVILEPNLIQQTFPNWKSAIPHIKEKLSCIYFDLELLALIKKCWRKEHIFINIMKDRVVKITRNTRDLEKIKDFIILMTLRFDEEDRKMVDENQMELFEAINNVTETVKDLEKSGTKVAMSVQDLQFKD